MRNAIAAACAAVLSTLITGCIGLEGITSGQIGCPASEITITDDHQGFLDREWTAQCQGHVYYCSSSSSVNGRNHEMSCKENEPSQPASSPRAPTGCQYDTQCKGDRVCQAGKCVVPADKS
jgi:hypothetical protein